MYAASPLLAIVLFSASGKEFPGIAGVVPSGQTGDLAH